MAATNLLITADILWKTLESRGQDPAPLFATAGLRREQMREPNARVQSGQFDALLARVTADTGDPCLGLHAIRHWHPSHFGALGYAWLASSTLRTALRRLQRYTKLVTGITTVAIEETPEGIAVVLTVRPGFRELPARDDFLAGLVLHMCRLNHGDGLVPLGVTFRHAPCDCRPSHAEYFRCPVRFGAERNTLLLSAETVDRPLVGGNPQLAQLHDQVIVQYLARLDRNDIVQRTRAAILDGLQSGRLSDEQVAGALHLSVRSLQRRLEEGGTNFRRLVDDTRRDVAQAYIRDRNVSLGEIAFLLGFSDASAFSRAYRRWTGKSPTDARAA